MGALPNVIVIGVTKCGTSALHYFLDLHPEISMSHPKELNFFMDGVALDRPVAITSPEEVTDIESTERNWRRGLEWYRRHFDARAPIRGESSPRYTAPWFPGVAERIASVAPEAKLILMVRDPVQRTLSHHAFLRAERREQRDAAEALAGADSVYLACSRYFEQLSPFREHFPSTSILVVGQEDLSARPEETMRAVYAFAGADPDFSTPKLARRRHRTAAKGRRYRVAQRLLAMPGMRFAYRLPDEVKWGLERLVARRKPAGEADASVDDGLRAVLVERLRPDAERFREAVGREFAEWSV